jgi:ribulose-phosphate 3-epimerase
MKNEPVKGRLFRAKIAPSILGADFSRLGEEVRDCERLGVDWLHLDIMDGHFVPNISFGPGVVKTIDKLTDRFLDVHLMLDEPQKYFGPFVEAGADLISFHIEVHSDPRHHCKALKKLGIKSGITVNPKTSVDKVLKYLEYFDLLLVMSVQPGFGGQKFMAPVLSKVEKARAFIDKNNLSTLVEIDGGIDAENAERCVAAGADVLVIGNSFFKSSDRAALTRKVQSLSRR